MAEIRQRIGAETAKAATSARFSRQFKKYKYFYAMLALPVIYFIMFKYMPMAGLILSFRKFSPGDSMLGSQWMGFTYFKMFMFQSSYWKVFANTLILSFYSLIIGFPINILFALLVNELRQVQYKREVQTVSYMPYFISTIVLAGMIMQFLSPSSGILNQVLVNSGIMSKPVNFIDRPEWFAPIYIISGIWQFTGWNAIIYLAALSGVDLELYEAAMIDGANRFRRILHITLPAILPTISIVLILNLGGILNVSFEKILALQTKINMDASDVIQTYVYRIGIQNTNYSYATAMGLFQGAVGLILLFVANLASKKASGESLW